MKSTTQLATGAVVEFEAAQLRRELELEVEARRAGLEALRVEAAEPFTAVSGSAETAPPAER